MEKDKSFVLKCDCTGRTNAFCDHDTTIQVYDDGDGHGAEIYIHASLRHFRNPFKRLWLATKYVLGIDNTYCTHTDTLMFQKDCVPVLEEVLEYIKK